jgi:hypothetical protein
MNQLCKPGNPGDLRWLLPSRLSPTSDEQVVVEREAEVLWQPFSLLALLQVSKSPVPPTYSPDPVSFLPSLPRECLPYLAAHSFSHRLQPVFSQRRLSWPPVASLLEWTTFSALQQAFLFLIEPSQEYPTRLDVPMTQKFWAYFLRHSPLLESSQQMRLLVLPRVSQRLTQAAYRLSPQPICPPPTSFSFQPWSTLTQLQRTFPVPAAQHGGLVKSMNVFNSTLPTLASCKTDLFPYKKSIFPGPWTTS